MKNKLLILIIIFAFVFTPFKASAQTIPFGGTLLWSHECACSGGWMMYIWDKYSKTVIPMVFQYGVSRLNGNYNIYTSGTSNLGSYFPGGICVMASTECEGGPTPWGTVTSYPLPGIGTSLR